MGFPPLSCSRCRRGSSLIINGGEWCGTARSCTTGSPWMQRWTLTDAPVTVNYEDGGSDEDMESQPGASLRSVCRLQQNQNHIVCYCWCRGGLEPNREKIKTWQSTWKEYFILAELKHSYFRHFLQIANCFIRYFIFASILALYEWIVWICFTQVISLWCLI